jgi:predicted  nucleic acid-binding Zn-ribbon protein
MKALLYVIAIAAIGAAGWFSYSTMQLFEEKKAERLELEKENVNLTASIKTKKKDAKAMEVARDAAKVKLIETEESRDNTESNLKLAKREAATWQSKIDEQKEKIDGFANVKVNIQKQFADVLGGRKVELNEIPALVKKLEDDLKSNNRKLEELQSLTEAAGKRVAGNNAQIDDLQTRMTKRAERIRANSLQGTITAVNHDWGFAVVSVPKKMPIDDASQLIVKRGNTFIGRLKINAIEAGRIMTDVDYQSMTPGMVVQPGDAVVLAKPVTR